MNKPTNAEIKDLYAQDSDYPGQGDNEESAFLALSYCL